MWHWIGYALALMSTIGLGYQLCLLWALRRFFHRLPERRASGEGVTILKPLYGAEPRLADNLQTFLAQDYSGPVQLLCGLSRADDPARLAVEHLTAQHPSADITLVINQTRHGSNAKIGNLINMMAAVEHDVMVLSDSDMAVEPGYLQVLLAALERPGTGAVTCLYQGRGDAGFWSQVSAGIISYVAMPDMVMGFTTGIEQPCMGSTIALRRDTLERIGGFPRFADVLADDNAIGAAVREQGLQVAMPPLLLTHACSEPDFGTLWRQKLRWAATIRQINPPGYCASIITRPLPLALLALPFVPKLAISLAFVAILLRQGVLIMVNRFANRSALPAYLLPLVDCLEFIVYMAALGARSVEWRGDRLTMKSDGRIRAREGQ